MSDNDCVIIRIPHDEAAARRERELKSSYTLEGARHLHDKAVAEGRLADAAGWSFYLALLEWTPPRDFKVGDVVHRRGVHLRNTLARTVKGVDGIFIIFGKGYAWVLAADYVLVKAVDDE